MPKLPEVGGVGRASTGALRAPAISAPRDTGDGLAAVGEVISQIGEAGVKAHQKVRTRRDLILRTREQTEFDRTAREDALNLETEQDATDPAVLEAFGGRLQANMDAVLAGHQGSEESRQRLEVRLEQIRAERISGVATMVNKQQRDLIDNEYASGVRALAVGGLDDIDDRLIQVDMLTEEFAPGFTRGEEEDKRRAARTQIVLGSVTPLLDQGTAEGVEAVDELLKRSDIVDTLEPEQLRKLKSKIVTSKAALEKGRVEGEQKLEKIAAIAGVSVKDLTPEQRLKAAGIAPPAGRETLSEQVRDFESVMGRPATEQEMSKMAGALTGDDAIFGKGLTGRAIARVTDDALGFANDTLGDIDDNRFIAAVVELQQPSMFPNPDTGVLEPRRRALSPFVTDALRRRGREDLIAEAEPTEPIAQAPAAPEQPQETIFGMASRITGPVPAAMEALGATPGIGEFVDAGEFIRPRKFVEQMTRDLVRVLQNSPKFAEAERAAIAKDVDLTGSVIDTPKAFRQRLVGMDDALAVRQQNAFNTAQSPLVTRQERQQSMDVLNALTNFRQRLGVPPLIKTAEEVRELMAEGKLRPGMEFRSPDGVVRVIPEAPQ